MSKFLTAENGSSSPDIEGPHAFVQYKGTDICMDFHCGCGEQFHFDGYFAYAVECGTCHQQWEMPQLLIPRKVCVGTYPGHVEMIKMLEPDEDIDR